MAASRAMGTAKTIAQSVPFSVPKMSGTSESLGSNSSSPLVLCQTKSGFGAPFVPDGAEKRGHPGLGMRVAAVHKDATCPSHPETRVLEFSVDRHRRRAKSAASPASGWRPSSHAADVAWAPLPVRNDLFR